MRPAAIPESIPSDPQAISQLVAHLAEAIEERDHFIEQLKHEVGRLRRWQFGTKAEYIPDDQQIFGFYGKLESDRDKAAREKESEPLPPREKKKGHGRRVIPDNLPRVEVVSGPLWCTA